MTDRVHTKEDHERVVAAWHRGIGPDQLHDALGWTREEYQRYGNAVNGSSDEKPENVLIEFKDTGKGDAGRRTFDTPSGLPDESCERRGGVCDCGERPCALDHEPDTDTVVFSSCTGGPSTLMWPPAEEPAELGGFLAGVTIPQGTLKEGDVFRIEAHSLQADGTIKPRLPLDEVELPEYSHWHQLWDRGTDTWRVVDKNGALCPEPHTWPGGQATYKQVLARCDELNRAEQKTHVERTHAQTMERKGTS